MRRRVIGAAALVAAALPAGDVQAHDGSRGTYATSYCLQGRMADGTFVRPGSAASNVLRLGTRIRLVGRSFFGRRRFTIRDTGGALGDGHLDLWHSSCSTSMAWGARRVRYRLGW